MLVDRVGGVLRPLERDRDCPAWRLRVRQIVNLAILGWRSRCMCVSFARRLNFKGLVESQVREQCRVLTQTPPL